MPLPQAKVDQITQGFLRYLTRTGQLSLLPQLARQQLRVAKTQIDSTTAIVHTVVPLTSDQTLELKSVLNHLFNHPVAVKNQISPDLLGGLSIKLGDKVIDISLKHKLDSLHQSLMHRPGNSYGKN